MVSAVSHLLLVLSRVVSAEQRLQSLLREESRVGPLSRRVLLESLPVLAEHFEGDVPPLLAAIALNEGHLLLDQSILGEQLLNEFLL